MAALSICLVFLAFAATIVMIKVNEFTSFEEVRAEGSHETLAITHRLPDTPEIPLPETAMPEILEKEMAQPAGASPENPEKKSKGTIIIVIDDVGYNIKQLEPFLKFPGPITFAVLPDVPFTRKAALMIKDAGKELILHQPMEALGTLDEGGGSIGASMSRVDIQRIVARNLNQVPGVVGMNNHMGSLATRDRALMDAVLDLVSRKGIYFLDSLTIGESVVASVAARRKIQSWERDVFLDNNKDRESMEKYMDEGRKIAAQYGRAVLIGHVWSAELAQTLMDLYPSLIEEGFSLSTISRVMMEQVNDRTRN